MKKILTSLLIICHALLYAQSEIGIDFKTKKVTISDKKTLRQNNTVIVKVNNIPTSAYKVSINKTDSVVSAGTPPALFGVLSFGDGFNSLLAGLTSYSIHNISSASIPTAQVANIPGRRPASDSVVPVSASRPRITDPCSSEDAADINEQIKEMRNQIFDFHYGFRDEVIKPADNLIYLINMGAMKDSADFRKKAEAIISARLKKDKELERNYVSYYDDILKLKTYDLVRTCSALRTGDSMLTVYKKNFDFFLNKFDTTFNEALIAKIYKQLIAPKPDTSFLSLPYTLKGDVTRLAIDITGIDATKTPQSYSTTLELDKHPNRLWAFTTGVFVSGLINNDFSILTHVQPNAGNPAKLDTVSYSIMQETNNSVSAGINALMHIGGYFSDHSGLGGFVAFGPGLTLENKPQVRVMLGAGLLAGRNNKLALTVGWMGGPVKRLSGNYNLTDTYNPAPTDITRDQFKGSWFVSLGYALFGK